MLLAVDHLAWIRGLGALSQAVDHGGLEAGFEGGGVLLLQGDLIAGARRELEALGWMIETRAVLALPISRQGLEPIAGRNPQVPKSLGGVNLVKLAASDLPDSITTEAI